MSVLVVVSHPDDEVLGCGATISSLTARGTDVRACILSVQAEARQYRPTTEALVEHVHKAQAILGAGEPILGTFPNIRFNTVAHVELVQFIEQALLDTKPDVVFTHHPGDLNDDHRHTSMACQAAVRLFQRRPGCLRPLRGLYYLEIPSSTDWAFASDVGAFTPTAFVPVGVEGVETKLRALAAYEGVMRPFPHPRSPEVIQGLAAVRGGQCGIDHAEAFQVAFQTLEGRL